MWPLSASQRLACLVFLGATLSGALLSGCGGDSGPGQAASPIDRGGGVQSPASQSPSNERQEQILKCIQSRVPQKPVGLEAVVLVSAHLAARCEVQKSELQWTAQKLVALIAQ